MSEEAEPAESPLVDKKRLWKLALIAVPALISGATSYLKSRAEATDQAKASYEALSKAVTQLQAETKSTQEENLVLKTQVGLLKELFDPAKREGTIGLGKVGTLGRGGGTGSGYGSGSGGLGSGKKAAKPASDAGTDGDGIAEIPPAKSEPPMQQLPASLDTVVQEYKSKK